MLISKIINNQKDVIINSIIINYEVSILYAFAIKEELIKLYIGELKIGSDLHVYIRYFY